MKTLLKRLYWLLALLVILPACEKKETELDQSLIIVHSSGFKYAIVSPSTGKVLHEVEPVNLNHTISSRLLSYNSEKALLLAKEPSNTYVKVIYACDMKTGQNLEQITSELMWDIQSFDAARTKPSIVFHGHPVSGGASAGQIYTINQNGTNVQQLTQTRELVESKELWYQAVPSWSPNGQQIAFTGTMRTPDPGAYWWGRSIIVMNANGSNKRILYNESDSNSGDHMDISWTRDGKFLVFLTTEHFSSPKNRVKVLNIEDKSIIDITDHLLVGTAHTTNLCTSPLENKILFNKNQPGGGDLHEIEYEIDENGAFQIKGTYKIKCKVVDGGLQFGAPRCQLWPGE
jgi:hypothetical protein